MKFAVRRTSSWLDEEQPPCEGAIRESSPRIDMRTCTEKEFNDRHIDGSSKWRDKGTNHKRVNPKKFNGAKISRDFPGEEWFIEINSMEELLNFYKKYGKIIIEESWNNPDLIQLEIYDDYRE